MIIRGRDIDIGRQTGIFSLRARFAASLLLLFSLPSTAFASTDQGLKLRLEPSCGSLENPTPGAIVIFRDSVPKRRVIAGFRLLNPDLVEAGEDPDLPKRPRPIPADQRYPVYAVYTDSVGLGDEYANFQGLAQHTIYDASFERRIIIKPGDHLEVAVYEAGELLGRESLGSYILNPLPIATEQTTIPECPRDYSFITDPKGHSGSAIGSDIGNESVSVTITSEIGGDNSGNTR